MSVELPREVIEHMTRTNERLKSGDDKMDALKDQAEDNGKALQRIESKLERMQSIDGCLSQQRQCASEREKNKLQPGVVIQWVMVASAALALVYSISGSGSNRIDIDRLNKQLGVLSEITEKIETQSAGAQELDK